jgi:hypothetical protein
MTSIQTWLISIMFCLKQVHWKGSRLTFCRVTSSWYRADSESYIFCLMSTIHALWSFSSVDERSHVGAITMHVTVVHVTAFVEIYSALPLTSARIKGNIPLRQFRLCQRCCWRFRSPDVPASTLAVTAKWHRPTKSNIAVNSNLRNFSFSYIM